MLLCFPVSCSFVSTSVHLTERIQQTLQTSVRGQWVQGHRWAVCVSFSSWEAHWCAHYAPWAEVRRLQESVSVQAAAAKSEGVCSSREGCRGPPDLSFSRSACHGQGAPSWCWVCLWSASMVAVMPEVGACLDHWSWGWSVCAHKVTEACVLVHGMWAHGEEPGDWGVHVSWEGCNNVSSSRRLAAAVLLVAEAASFLCRGGCWGSLQQTLQNPLVCKLPVFHTAEGLLSPQWPGLSVFSAEQAAGDRSGIRRVAYADVFHPLLFFAIFRCLSWSPSPQWSFLCSHPPLVATLCCCRFLFDSCVLLGQVPLVANCVIIGPRLVHPPLSCRHLSLPVHFSSLLS